jgi:predicted 3-demethylubiquinone-9 3-methyltransferase (glyoxalase superfamily)
VTRAVRPVLGFPGADEFSRLGRSQVNRLDLRSEGLQKRITTFLTFDDQAEEAVSFYTSVFPDSRIVGTRRYGDAGPGPAGQLMTATFELAGQEFMALNGGPSFTFAQGISLFVDCETQEEVDDLWERLSEGGEEGPCGWLQDRYGVSWQVIPRALGEMLGDEDPERAGRVMNAMLQMTKIEIEGLRAAYEGRPEES